jgi:hypothetical protein
LSVARAIPIKDDELWSRLSITKDYSKESSAWAQSVKGSLRRLSDEDASAIHGALARQNGPDARVYDYDEEMYASLVARPVQTTADAVVVTVPTASEEKAEEQEVTDKPNEVRESIQIQALLAFVGSKMGFKIWVPRGDRERVVAQLSGGAEAL